VISGHRPAKPGEVILGVVSGALASRFDLSVDTVAGIHQERRVIEALGHDSARAYGRLACPARRTSPNLILDPCI